MPQMHLPQMRMPRAACLRRVALACLLACAWPLSAAELGPEMTPEQVAAESYARMRAGDWAGAAETFDPAALKQFRGMFGAGDDASAMAPMLRALLGMADDKSLDTLDDGAFFAGFLQSMMGRMGGVVALRGQEILGGVPEGDDRIHLVARSRAEAMGLTMTNMEVVTLNRTARGWRLALSGGMEGMATLFRKAAEGEKTPRETPAQPR